MDGSILKFETLAFSSKGLLHQAESNHRSTNYINKHRDLYGSYLTQALLEASFLYFTVIPIRDDTQQRLTVEISLGGGVDPCFMKKLDILLEYIISYHLQNQELCGQCVVVD